MSPHRRKQTNPVRFRGNAKRIFVPRSSRAVRRRHEFESPRSLATRAEAVDNGHFAMDDHGFVWVQSPVGFDTPKCVVNGKREYDE